MGVGKSLGDFSATLRLGHKPTSSRQIDQLRSSIVAALRLLDVCMRTRPLQIKYLGGFNACDNTPLQGRV